MSDDVLYVARDTTRLYAAAEGSAARHELLWGDRVQVLSRDGVRWRVRARGMTGWADPAALGATSLLEVYFIDVGQGDGVLVRFPDDRHVMIDGGYNRAKQPTGKNAADFVDWKFFEDYGRQRITLDAMICSHNDADHYGGLWDLLDATQHQELDTTELEVRTFCHAGVSWWKGARGGRHAGRTVDGFITQLLDGKTSVRAALRDGAEDRLQGEWAEFMRCVLACGCRIVRLSDRDAWVPGFAPDDGAGSLRVLGPVEPERGRLYDLGSDSQNTNGNSVLLRLDYGRARILLTGDLNRKAQQRLLAAYAGRRLELACDVAKGCHHGSDDVSFEFLSAMGAGATIISSGDNESHAHPRPTIVAASALAGHVRVEDDRLVTPLVYSTEIARSARLGRITRVATRDGASVEPGPGAAVHYQETSAGALRPKTGSRPLAGAYVVSGMIYGLVNVRTDGERILCATLNEKERSWDVEVFGSRF